MARNHDHRDDAIPEGLADDLRSLYGADDAPGSRVDDELRRAARERFEAIESGRLRIDRPGRTSVVIRRIGLAGGSLAAAALAIAAIVWMTPAPPTAPQGPIPAPGMTRQQAQKTFEQRANEEMQGDRLAFAESERAEAMLMATDEADASAVAGELADARSDRASAPAATEPALGRAAKAPRREDFNEDGRVDVRDAMALARTLEAGAWSIGERWDLNDDGRVDVADVRAISLAAVSVGESLQTVASRAGRRAREGGASFADDAVFRAFDVWIDPDGAPLAAFQIEIIAEEPGAVRLVGIEDADGAPFEGRLLYDASALGTDRVILGAFTTAAENLLPRGDTRVARIHVSADDASALDAALSIRLVAASTALGAPVEGQARLVANETP